MVVRALALIMSGLTFIILDALNAGDLSLLLSGMLTGILALALALNTPLPFQRPHTR